MLNQSLFSSKKEDWETPDSVFDELNSEFHFVLDVAAQPHNAKCPLYLTPETNGLEGPWFGSCWCNPPYGRQLPLWVEKAATEALRGVQTVMLIPARTDTRYFHRWIYQKPGVEVRFLKGRIRFKGAKHCAPFPSMVVVFKGVAE